jgi:ribosomal protein S18 acetylase RimI-like enzyme
MNFKQYLILKEIKNNSSLLQSSINYDQFIDWAKSEADKINLNREKFLNFDFQWSEGPDGVKVIVYDKNNATGYVGLEKFEDGYKISTLGVKPQARGKGLASIMYDYVLSKTKLYSDKMQTPEAKSLWVKLANKYKVKGYNQSSKQNFDVINKNNELVSNNSNYILYSDEENDNFLVAQK